jgi:hypothetical protein
MRDPEDWDWHKVDLWFVAALAMLAGFIVGYVVRGCP